MDSSLMLMTVAMIGVFYFMLIRPENNRKKKAEEMRNSIKKGERITTIGGMKGRVVQVTDDSVVFETSEDRVRIEIAKWGIQSTESMEAAQVAQQKSGGLFRRKSAPSEDAVRTDEPEKTEFDPEIK